MCADYLELGLSNYPMCFLHFYGVPAGTTVITIEIYDNEDGTVEIRRKTYDLSDIGGSVDLDTTLSVEGKAADAKAVGDAIGKVESALDGIIEIQNSLIGGEQA